MEENEKVFYTITLSDGTQIRNLTLNGNNFVSVIPITEEMFEGNLTPVTISDGTHDEVHQYMDLVQITKVPDKSGDLWYFVLRDVSGSELALQKMNSNIQYLSMMTGVDLF